MASILELAMVLCFGAAWPASILRSLRARTAKGKSLMFLVILFVGYLFGIASKFVGGHLNYVVVFYFLNLTMVGVDIALYFRNRRLERRQEKP